MSGTLATAIAFAGRVAPFDAVAIAVSVLLIFDLVVRLVLESGWGPAATPGYVRAGTRPLLGLFVVCVVARLVLVGFGLY